MDAYPEDWTVDRLGNIGELYKGSGISRAQADSGDLPAIRYGELYTTHSDYVKEYRSRISAEVAKVSVLMKRGDIAFAASGETEEEIGKCAVVCDDGVYAGGDLICFRAKAEIDPLFWGFMLNTPVVQRQKTAAAQGATVIHIRRNSIADLIVGYPPIEEQKRIGAALKDIDSLIDNLSKRIEKKKAIKQGAMQELLTGKKRLPGFEGEWEMVRIGNIGDFYGGLSGKTAADFGHGEAQYITFMNVLTNIVINRHQVGKVCVYPGEHQNAVKKGDLFFNVSSETPEEVAMCAALLEDMPNTYLNSFCCGFRLFDDSNDPLFISYYVNSHEGRKMTKFLAQGLTRHNLSKDAFRKMEMNWPKKSEQRAIAKVLGDMDAEIAKLEAKREKLIGIKKGMMSDLLTGKVRLKGGTE